MTPVQHADAFLGAITQTDVQAARRPRRDLTKEPPFGRLTVIGFAFYKKGHAHWHCVCACGTSRTVDGQNLLRGLTLSCGCYLADINRQRAVPGDSNSRLFPRWKAMLARCRNPRNKSYANYGGRGITVCERWLTFTNFLADMGEPEPRMTLERRDNEGPYHPDNCYWATRRVQGNNTRRNWVITWQDQTHTLTQWGDILGFKEATLRYRLKRWSIEKAFTTPLRYQDTLPTPKEAL